jgi:GMP synthase (glutamine-hydrolysing)
MRILILDYSTDGSEAAAIGRWLPAGAEVVSRRIDTEASLPEGLWREGWTHAIHSGSSLRIVEEAAFTARAVEFARHAREAAVRQMGVCYGHQLLALALVGRKAVRAAANGVEAGWREVAFTEQGAAHLGTGAWERLWQYHHDEVTELPEGGELWATNGHTRVQAWGTRDGALLGVQFHPEFDREAGNAIYREARERLAERGYDADELVRRGPTLDAGRVFFGAFLRGGRGRPLLDLAYGGR